MSDPIGPGPRYPSLLVFVATAAIAATVGLVTGDIRAFILAGLGAVIVLCTVYALLRRRFGWRHLRVDERVNLVGLLNP